MSLALRWQFRPHDFVDGRPQRLEATVRASSVLEPSVEHARNAADANPLTAWCAEPARGNGGSGSSSGCHRTRTTGSSAAS